MMRNYTAHAIQSGLRSRHAVLLSRCCASATTTPSLIWEGWLRSLGLERWLGQLQGSRQRLFGFSRQPRLMTFHEDGGMWGPRRAITFGPRAPADGENGPGALNSLANLARKNRPGPGAVRCMPTFRPQVPKLVAPLTFRLDRDSQSV